MNINANSKVRELEKASITGADEHWMRLAIEQAQLAQEQGEIPVGAIIVHDQNVIGRGYNQPIRNSDPCAHAEIIALRDAAQTLANYRLTNCALYVTLEPCPMCAGAIINSRIKRVIFGAFDSKAGAGGSVLQILRHPQLNHICALSSGVMQHECEQLLAAFFQQKRESKNRLSGMD